jgi:hypothetical protein
MKPTDNTEGLVDWVQIHDLVGDMSDLEQRQMLSDMWRDMRADVQVAWDGLAACQEEAELRGALHALRGLVSMWGLVAVANRMHECEKGPAPAAVWRREVGELTLWLGRSFAEIEGRYPHLATS